jgi:3-hydroxyacyl-[acyl-carrier-protein] dehydratase
MPQRLLFDLDSIDLDRVEYDVEEIERVNPHRGEMRLLDGVIYCSHDQAKYVAYHDTPEDAFWVPGHIPGRPLMPGVLMVEAAAQLASFATLTQMPDVEFMGFARLENVSFRGQVYPGQRLYLLAEMIELRRKRSVCYAQGMVDGRISVECKITGMPM